MTQLLRIAHVVLSLQPGGLENGVVNVINGLDPGRFQSSVVCLKVAGEFASRIRSAATPIHVMGLKPGHDWTLPWRLAQLLRRERTDIIHTRNAEAFFYGSVAALLGGAPHLIHSEHGRTFNDHPRRFVAQRVLSARADAVFTVSDQLRHDLCRHVGLRPARIEVLHNGVDLSRFAGASRENARRRLGLTSESIVVGSIGRLVAVKNFALLLHALSDPSLAKMQLVLVGEGPERSALEALAASKELSGRVHFLGHRDDIPELLPALDIFVLPSVSEGMSNTLLEAMACGVAPVASRVGGNGEIIIDGSSGLLFDSGDVLGLRDALRRLLADSETRDRMGAAARQRVLAAFDMRAMIRNYESLYERVANPSGRSTCPA